MASSLKYDYFGARQHEPQRGVTAKTGNARNTTANARVTMLPGCLLLLLQLPTVKDGWVKVVLSVVTTTMISYYTKQTTMAVVS